MWNKKTQNQSLKRDKKKVFQLKPFYTATNKVSTPFKLSYSFLFSDKYYYIKHIYIYIHMYTCNVFIIIASSTSSLNGKHVQDYAIPTGKIIKEIADNYLENSELTVTITKNVKTFALFCRLLFWILLEEGLWKHIQHRARWVDLLHRVHS